MVTIFKQHTHLMVRPSKRFSRPQIALTRVELESHQKASLFVSVILWQALNITKAAIELCKEANYGWHIRPKF